jgi:2-haloacid dehalogenase
VIREVSDQPPSGILFDAYGTLFDVYSLASLADQLFPGHGAALAALWRDKQVEYSRLRTLCDRYVDFLTITEDALHHACARLSSPYRAPPAPWVSIWGLPVLRP